MDDADNALTSDASIHKDEPPTEHEIADWSFSTCQMLSPVSPEVMNVDIQHPNWLGTSEKTSGRHENDRLLRLCSRYIFRDLATREQKSRRVRIFQKNAPATLLKECQEKTCFERDEILTGPNPGLEEEIQKALKEPVHKVTMSSMVERSYRQLNQAFSSETSDAIVVRDIFLGFSRNFSISELHFTLPTVDNAVSDSSSSTDVQVNDANVLRIVISYRDTTAKNGYILNIETTFWPSVLATIAHLCSTTGHSHFALWTDQILSRRKPSAAMRWVSSGVLPYMMFPVVYVMRSVKQLKLDLKRMWISVEHLAAALCHGIIHCGPPLESEQLPFEWSIVSDTDQSSDDGTQLTWMFGMGCQLKAAVTKLASVIMCGMVRNKAMSWMSDAQDLIDWACSVSSTSLRSGFLHTFTCEECMYPRGYNHTHRYAAIINSCARIVTHLPVDSKGRDVDVDNLLVNSAHPRFDVPALIFNYLGRKWDGTREWVAESCLWGSGEDDTLWVKKKDVMRKMKVLVPLNEKRKGPGQGRSVAVIQFCERIDSKYVPISLGSHVVMVGYLLVGLLDVQKGGAQSKGRMDETILAVFSFQNVVIIRGPVE